VVATALGAGAAPRRAARDRFRRLDVFAQALSYIENNYVDDVNERALIYGAVSGMVERLDSHSSFLPPERYREVREDTEGQFGGVGMVVVDDPDLPVEESVPVVASVVPGSPAARAEVRAGDRVLAVDRAPTAGKGVASWRRKLRGAPGTPVELSMVRADGSAPRTVALVREIIRMPVVDHALLVAGVGYLQVRQFQGDTDAEVTRALEGLRAAAGGELGGLVLDLRGNPGGLLDQGVKVADLFLADGLIVTILG
jgi:carboxyl-terminal processing protease